MRGFIAQRPTRATGYTAGGNYEERTEMHTQEPWKVDPDDRPGYEWNNHIVSATDPNQTICFMTHDNTPENIEGEANARRIVACVNACKGIKTESLEMEVLSWITDETGESSLKRERDELLEARAACGERLIEVEQQRDKLLNERRHIRYLLTLAYAKLYNHKFALKDPALISQLEKYLQNSSDV